MTAILIVFEYQKVLSGAIIDLYQSYCWVKNFTDDIHIITDIKVDLERFIKVGVELNYVTSLDPIADLTNCLAKGLKNNKLVIYYSGHGLKNSIVLPNETHYSLTDFRDLVVKYGNFETEIFWICDCCNPNGLNLAFKLIDNRFRLNNYVFVEPKIILITSAEINQLSIGDCDGSIFSKRLFQYLTVLNEDIDGLIVPNNKNRNLQRLIRTLKGDINKQIVCIYSSYLIDPILWNWVGRRVEYSLKVDQSLNIFIFELQDNRYYIKEFYEKVEEVKKDSIIKMLYREH